MKNILFIFLLSLTIIGCKKNGVQPKGYVGTWEMLQQSGTITGATTTFPTGEGNLLVLNLDSTYQRYSKFQFISKGTFKIVKNGVNWANNTYDALYFDQNTHADFIFIDGNQLTIGNTFPDGVITLYERRN
ncbi:hypothetical protein GCM10027049_01260 [Mucilaginibacter puniceus]